MEFLMKVFAFFLYLSIFFTLVLTGCFSDENSTSPTDQASKAYILWENHPLSEKDCNGLEVSWRVSGDKLILEDIPESDCSGFFLGEAVYAPDSLTKYWSQMSGPIELSAYSAGSTIEVPLYDMEYLPDYYPKAMFVRKLPGAEDSTEFEKICEIDAVSAAVGREDSLIAIHSYGCFTIAEVSFDRELNESWQHFYDSLNIEMIESSTQHGESIVLDKNDLYVLDGSAIQPGTLQAFGDDCEDEYSFKDSAELFQETAFKYYVDFFQVDSNGDTNVVVRDTIPLYDADFIRCMPGPDMFGDSTSVASPDSVSILISSLTAIPLWDVPDVDMTISEDWNRCSGSFPTPFPQGYNSSAAYSELFNSSGVIHFSLPVLVYLFGGVE